MKFRKHLEDIDFDGAEVVDVARKDDVVIVYFRKGILLPSHPAHSRFSGTLDSYEISFFGLKNEEALKYVGVGESVAYLGKIPVESLEHIIHEGDQFTFGGYVEREPWYEWRFNANEYEVRLGNS